MEAPSCCSSKSAYGLRDPGAGFAEAWLVEGTYQQCQHCLHITQIRSIHIYQKKHKYAIFSPPEK
ncbi:unnamed protein product [Menidia menidia]|uniref:(Atlantic silverside) hypothetical protein n=1 Tax=Menidia menidia TaxID=238744 RepID=A0A8S4BDQ8_9TELE|nr:unnamed protein product [Menidia menidia]